MTGRESHYDNEALYGVDVVPGAEGTGSLPTWKASLVWEPLEGIRFRGSQSHDSRAPDPRDLYYSQTLRRREAAFGIDAVIRGRIDHVPHSLCTINLLGNVQPEAGNVQHHHLGLVFTPAAAAGTAGLGRLVPHPLTNGIEGGNASPVARQLYCGAIRAGCTTMQFRTAVLRSLSFNGVYYVRAGAVVRPRHCGARDGS